MQSERIVGMPKCRSRGAHQRWRVQVLVCARRILNTKFARSRAQTALTARIILRAIVASPRCSERGCVFARFVSALNQRGKEGVNELSKLLFGFVG